MSNRVEHQKLNQTTAELSFGWVFGVQLGLRQTQALIKTKTIRRRRVPRGILLQSSNSAGGTLLLFIALVLISACVCRRPSWTPTNGQHCVAVWVRFSVQLDYSCRLKSVSANVEKRVCARSQKLDTLKSSFNHFLVGKSSIVIFFLTGNFSQKGVTRRHQSNLSIHILKSSKGKSEKSEQVFF